jgi:hypothetical protein
MVGEDNSKQFAIINGPMVDAHTRLYQTGPILKKLKADSMYDKRVWYKGELFSVRTYPLIPYIGTWLI